jgi:plastocyanin
LKRFSLLLASLAVVMSLAWPMAAAAASQVPSESVTLAVKSDTEHAKKGSDGKWHDAFLPGNFTARSGSKVTVSISNYDTAVHTFTSSALGLNVKIAAGSAANPKVTTFSFTAPKAGNYTWMCMGNCDTWAMTHMGFMFGSVKITA